VTSDPTDARYAERLWPTPAVWSVLTAFGASFGLILYPVDPAVAAAVAVLGALLAPGLTAAWTPLLEVTDDGRSFRAGRAQIPVELLGAVEPLDREQMRRARGPGLDARAYLCLRGWLGQGVRVQLVDPADPTPYWLVSSRRPEQLAAALSRTAASR
jgi:hypothetical protein